MWPPCISDTTLTGIKRCDSVFCHQASLSRSFISGEFWGHIEPPPDVSQYGKHLVQTLFQMDKVVLSKSDTDMAVDGNSLIIFLSCVTSFVSKWLASAINSQS